MAVIFDSHYKNNSFFGKLLRLPKSFLVCIILNALYGFLILYSASGNSLDPWAIKQIIHFLIFFPIMIFIGLMDIRKIYNLAYPFYLVVICMLIGIELFGHVAMGAKRWLSIGGFRLQPSEPAKIAIIMFLARYFNDIGVRGIHNIRSLLIAIICVVVPTAMIIKQPDLGTGMIILIVSAMLFFLAGARLWKFIVLFSIILTSMPIIWHHMHEYQKKRVEVFLDPEKDPFGAGYNIVQSKIAIGSGGIFGKGLGEGSQSHLGFLPEHQTDFIFACLSEDLGLIGSLLLMSIYTIITYMTISIATNSRSIFGKLLANGVACIFFAHIFINLGMVMGMLPVVGIPLPLISYGGTITGSILIGFGLVINIYVNRYVKI